MEPELRPTREELFARLREIEDVSSDEKLATRLGIGVRTLARWKKGEGMKYEDALLLLDRAGAISWPTPDDDPLSESVMLVDALEEELENLAEAVLDQRLPRLRRHLARLERHRARGEL